MVEAALLIIQLGVADCCIDWGWGWGGGVLVVEEARPPAADWAKRACHAHRRRRWSILRRG